MTGDTDSRRLEESLRAALAAPAPPAGQSVQAQMARIAAAYGARPSGSAAADDDVLLSGLTAAISPATAAEACLVPALAAMGWIGVIRDVTEALPYYDRIRDVEALRSVLAHLNYQTRRQPANLADIHADMMPCLFSSDGVSVWLLIDRAASGELLLFDGTSGNWRQLDPPQLEGVAYPISELANEQAKPIRGPWLGSVIRRFTPLVAKIFALSLVVNLSVLAIPLYTIHLFDLGIGARASDVVVYLAAGALVAVGAAQALRRLRGRALAYLGARLDSIIAVASFQQLLQMPISMTDSAPIGTQISRLRQFESIRDVFTGTLATAIVDVPFILVFLAAIAFIGGPVVWIPVSLLAVFGVMLAITMPLTRSHANKSGEAKSNLEHLLLELIGKRTTIRELNAERIWIARYDELAALSARRNYRAQLFNGFIQSLAQSLVSLAGICTLGFGALMVMSGAMTTGALIGVMALVWCVLSPLQTTFLTLNRLEQAMATFKLVNRLMGIEVERNLDQRLSFHRKFKGGVGLSRLVFRYPGTTDPVLRGIQLDIKPGEVIAVTGTSGAGKSTVLKLIAGLYPATAGAVLADGLDIRQLDPAEWRSAVAFAPQTASFFHGTVSQNLRLACPDASDDELARAASDMGLDKYPSFFPDGLDTRLSAAALGQLPDAVKQRLLLARCFLKKSSLYLLDMPAVNLDTAGDAALVARIRELKGKATVIFTTYRPSHMRLADRVIVLAGGQVVMEGPAEKVADRLAAA